MGIKFEQAFELLGNACPVCGNNDFKNIVMGTKKMGIGVEQMFFFCLDCGAELSKECGKICSARIFKIMHAETGKVIKLSAFVAFENLGSYFTIDNPDEKESRRVLKVLTAWNIPLLGPPLPTGNE